METFHIDKLANSGVPMEICGKTLFVTQVTLRDQGRLQSVIRSLQPNPMNEAKDAVKGLAPDLAKEIIRDARKDLLHYPAAITSPEGLNILLTSEEGQKELIKAALGKRQNLSDSDVDGLIDALTYPQFMRLASIAISGEDPEADPKA